MAALRIAFRVLATLLVVAVAGYVGWGLWNYYTLSPGRAMRGCWRMWWSLPRTSPA